MPLLADLTCPLVQPSGRSSRYPEEGLYVPVVGFPVDHRVAKSPGNISGVEETRLADINGDARFCWIWLSAENWQQSWSSVALGTILAPSNNKRGCERTLSAKCTPSLWDMRTCRVGDVTARYATSAPVSPLPSTRDSLVGSKL